FWERKRQHLGSWQLLDPAQGTLDIAPDDGTVRGGDDSWHKASNGVHRGAEPDRVGETHPGMVGLIPIVKTSSIPLCINFISEAGVVRQDSAEAVGTTEDPADIIEKRHRFGLVEQRNGVGVQMPVRE